MLKLRVIDTSPHPTAHYRTVMVRTDGYLQGDGQSKGDKARESRDSSRICKGRNYGNRKKKEEEYDEEAHYTTKSLQQPEAQEMRSRQGNKGKEAQCLSQVTQGPSGITFTLSQILGARGNCDERVQRSKTGAGNCDLAPLLPCCGVIAAIIP